MTLNPSAGWASSLPILMLALPAGALADIVDRRKLLIISQAPMLAAAGALSWLTILHLTTPVLLLVLTFALEGRVPGCDRPARGPL